MFFCLFDLYDLCMCLFLLVFCCCPLGLPYSTFLTSSLFGGFFFLFFFLGSSSSSLSSSSSCSSFSFCSSFKKNRKNMQKKKKKKKKKHLKKGSFGEKKTQTLKNSRKLALFVSLRPKPKMHTSKQRKG